MFGMAGTARWGRVRCVEAGTARLGEGMWPGNAGHGRAGMASLDPAGGGRAWPVRLGWAGRGMVRHGQAGATRHFGRIWLT